jgi:tetratricopeptide (TPR) repeat protein
MIGFDHSLRALCLGFLAALAVNAAGAATPAAIATPTPAKPAAATAAKTPAPPSQPTTSAPKASVVPGPPAAPAVTRVEVKAELVGAGLTRLSYPFAGPVSAAVFQREGYLWVVFNLQNATFSHSGIDMSPTSRIGGAEQMPNGQASVIRYRLRAGQAVSVEKSGPTWIVDIKDSPSVPLSPVEVGTQGDEAGNDRIFMLATEVGPKVELVDPAVGDRLEVVPLMATGRGVSTNRDFVEFNILASAQGIVVAPKAEGVKISRYRNGVMISKADGLKILKSKLRETVAARPEGLLDDKNPADNGDAAADQFRLIDFNGWRRGPPETYTDVYHNLLARIIATKPVDRNAARWDMARFYLGYGMVPDALGVMALMLETNPNLADDPDYRAVRGVANVLARHYDEALADLSAPGLRASPDAALWRTIADERLGLWDAALTDYMKGWDVLTLYDQTDRARFELAGSRAACQKGNTDFMSRELELMSRYTLPASQASEVQYLKGRMYELAGDGASALTAYKKVIAGGDRRTGAEAQFALTDLKLKEKLITVNEAIDRLERLRFAWRGDDFELDLLDRLGHLYFEAGDHRTGFATLRQAVSYFPKSQKTIDISLTMDKIFRQLFLEGGADSMPPVTALALYYDFREMTPLGADGDEMIRRLADRLVAVDLLDRAAELLEHQVKYRLEGVAQATVAARLAMIYIMDSKPQKALDIIRATRQAVMPPDIEEHRRRIEVRALTDLKQYEEALVLLEGDKSHEADLLRADIYWGSGDWKNVVALEARLLGKRWEPAVPPKPVAVKGKPQQAAPPPEPVKPLEPDERRQILRMALAMSLSDDKAGLKDLRDHYLTLMAGGAYENAFTILTDRDGRSPTEVEGMSHDIAGIDTLETFMNSYKKEFSSDKPVAKPATPAKSATTGPAPAGPAKPGLANNNQAKP